MYTQEELKLIAKICEVSHDKWIKDDTGFHFISDKLEFELSMTGSRLHKLTFRKAGSSDYLLDIDLEPTVGLKEYAYELYKSRQEEADILRESKVENANSVLDILLNYTK